MLREVSCDWYSCKALSSPLAAATAFFENLCQAEVAFVGGMELLKIASCPPWLAFRGDLIVKRDVYGKLHDIIHPGPKGITRFAIVGNPGIGKSYFALYELFEAVRAGKRVVFFYQPTNTSYVFVPKEGTCWCVTGVAAEQCDLFLYDCATKREPILPTASNVLLFCSPDTRNYKQFLKEEAAVILYMPVWTLDEMSAFAAYGSTRQEALSTFRFADYEARLAKFGCIPRYVFGHMDYEKSLEDACSNCTALKLFKWGKNLHMSEHTSHMVLHLIPDETLRNIQDVAFASPYVQSKVVNALEKSSYSDTLQFLEGAKPYMELATLRGFIFEVFAHKELRKGGTFTVKRLGKTAKSDLVLPKCDNAEFHTPSEISWAQQGVYWTPDYRTFCSADAINPPNNIFQMTVASSHHIQASGIEKISAAAPPTTKTFKLYFVVPSDVFDKFTSLQPIYKDRKVVQRINIPQQLEQYVLCIDTQQNV